VGCYIWYSEEKLHGRGRSQPRPLLAVPNVTAHPSTASVPVTVLLYNGPSLCGFDVVIKGLIPPTTAELSIISCCSILACDVTISSYLTLFAPDNGYAAISRRTIMTSQPVRPNPDPGLEWGYRREGKRGREAYLVERSSPGAAAAPIRSIHRPRGRL